MNAKKFDGCSCSVAPRKAFLEQNTAATSFSFECGFGADCTIFSFSYYGCKSLESVLIECGRK